MTFREVMLAIDGLNNGKRFQRLCVLAIAASGMNAKAVVPKIEKIIPIDGDGIRKLKVRESARELLKKFKDIDEKAKVKNVGRP